MNFKDTQFMTAQEKELVLKRFKQFIKAILTVGIDTPESFEKIYKHFSDRLYKHLHLHCGYIAHYDRHGFYTTYFNGDVDDLDNFIENFNYDYPGYEDLGEEMQKVLDENKQKLYEVFGKKTKERDIREIKSLMSKHNIMEVKIQ